MYLNSQGYDSFQTFSGRFEVTLQKRADRPKIYFWNITAVSCNVPVFVPGKYFWETDCTGNTPVSIQGKYFWSISTVTPWHLHDRMIQVSNQLLFQFRMAQNFRKKTPVSNWNRKWSRDLENYKSREAIISIQMIFNILGTKASWRIFAYFTCSLWTH